MENEIIEDGIKTTLTMSAKRVRSRSKSSNSSEQQYLALSIPHRLIVPQCALGTSEITVPEARIAGEVSLAPQFHAGQQNRLTSSITTNEIAAATGKHKPGGYCAAVTGTATAIATSSSMATASNSKLCRDGQREFAKSSTPPPLQQRSQQDIPNRMDPCKVFTLRTGLG